MDAVINQQQARDLYTKSRRGGYTDINAPYHFSWHANNRIVVGVGAGPGAHRNFICAVDNAFAITLRADAGALPVGAGGINAATLTTRVSDALKRQFRILIRTAAFNNMGRTPQRVTLRNTKIINRLENETLFVNVGAHLIEIRPAQSHTFVDGSLNGLVLTRNLPGNDTYYRNIDVREDAALGNGEPLKVTANNLPGAVTPVALTGAISGAISVQVV
ncbi:MAG TPA: hypothetical protein VL635_20180 [Trinickia sp.]|jgi:hypothetical protein|nr:hypothetical protein [Trinickia sp.]